MTNANDWKRFEFYIPGVGKVVMATDGNMVRGIATNLMPMTVRLTAPDEQMEKLQPHWDRATGGPKPEWFDDPQGTFARLRRERDELEEDFVALYKALDRLHLRALMSRSPEGHDTTAFNKACGDSSILIDRLRERPWHKKKDERMTTPDKRISKSQLPELINWEAVLATSRYAGGHEEAMRAIFEGQAEVIAEFIENGYDGAEAFAYQFADGSVVVATDYFGSCGGCDGWEGAGDDDVREMVREIVNNSRVFSDLDAALEFCRGAGKDASDYSFRVATNLVSILEGKDV